MTACNWPQRATPAAMDAELGDLAMSLDEAPRIGEAGSESRFRTQVDAIASDGAARAPELLPMLDECFAAYAERGAGAVVRMRSHALLALASGPSPWPQAMPFVLEELESGRSPVLIAAAASVLPAIAEPNPAWAPYLLNALTILRQHDDAVDLSVYGGTPVGEVNGTALDEVLRCLLWLGDAASGIRSSLLQLAAEPGGISDTHREMLHQLIDGLPAQCAEDLTQGAWDCCAWTPPISHASRARSSQVVTGLSTVRFEDQDARQLVWADFFVGRPTVVVFFYTRCDNAMKCSLSITKLARVQKLLQQTAWGASVKTVAITYDADFDLPHRLRGYVESRGMALGDDHRVLRVTFGGQVLQAYFELGVSFVASLVNRHRIEAFLLDAHGRVAVTYRRMAWQEQRMLDDLHRLVERRAAGVSHGVVHGLSPLWALALALFPKCPICGVGYLSLTGLVALPQLPGWYWTWPLFALALLLNLAVVAWQARVHKRWGGLVLGAAGAMVLLGLGMAADSRAAIVVGVSLSVLGALYSALAFSRATRRAHRVALP